MELTKISNMKFFGERDSNTLPMTLKPAIYFDHLVSHWVLAIRVVVQGVRVCTASLCATRIFALLRFWGQGYPLIFDVFVKDSVEIGVLFSSATQRRRPRCASALCSGRDVRTRSAQLAHRGLRLCAEKNPRFVQDFD